MTPSPSVWIVMLALLGTHLAGMGVFLAVPVLAPAIAAEVGIPAALAGVHTALVYAGALVSGPLAGAFIRRYGGIRVLQAGLVVCGAAVAVAALGHPAALALSALLGGLGHGPVTPAGSHLLAQKAPPNRRALIFSLKQCGVPAGAMLIAAATPAIAAAFGWRAGVLAVAAFLAASALVLQPLRGPLDAERDRAASLGNLRAAWGSAVGSLAILRHHPVLRRLTFTGALYGISQFCFSSFFVVFQVEALGVPLTEAGLRLALAQAAGVAGRVAWGLLADRVGAAPVLRGLGLGAAAAGIALLLAGPGSPGLVVALAGMAMGATAIGWNGVFLAETARLAPEGQVGAATAAVGFVFGACMLVGPPLFTLMVQATGGYALGFGFCVVTALAGAALLRGIGGVAKP
ncbi:MFS transporter [Roseomonas sp. HF4]|uniref:MFS transporter n=1 Tax=Roseomonas sp. HF4 TaxID=2562313 RepID=UPI0010BFFEF9|nr:MFS transporter [Roseomonas sp. HF4]